MRVVWWWLAVSLLLALTCPPSEARDDWQLWLEHKWSVKLSPEVTLVGKAEERFRDDLGDYYKQIARAGLSVKPVPWLKLEPYYNYGWSETSGDTTTRENRVFLNVVPLWSWGPVHLEDRNRVEFRYRNGVDDWRYRNKPTLSLDIGRDSYGVTPYVANEVFYGARDGAWNRNRFSIGLKKAFAQKLGTEVYYLMESNKDGRDWNEFHVLGVVMQVNL